MSVTIIVEALKSFQKYVDQLPAVARTAMRIGLNSSADNARKKLLPEAMQKEIAFPSGYLAGDDKLSVARRATDQNLEAVVEARARATSLARFSPGLTAGTRPAGGVRVTVKPGHTVLLPRAFPVRLKAGSASVREDDFNLGVAVRLKPGTQLRNKYKISSVMLADGVFILYAPSVDQVMRTVLDEGIDEKILDDVETEFLRQFVRLSEG